MKTVVIDTNILIDYANGYAAWMGKLIGNSEYQFILPTIVIAEYFTSTALEAKKEEEIADRTFALFHKKDLTEEIAKILGRILRYKSYPSGAGLADLIIAATTLSVNGELATTNRKDFTKIPNLRFFEPEKHIRWK